MNVHFGSLQLCVIDAAEFFFSGIDGEPCNKRSVLPERCQLVFLVQKHIPLQVMGDENPNVKKQEEAGGSGSKSLSSFLA